MKSIYFKVFCYLLIIIVLGVYLFPLYIAFNTSLKSSQEFMLNSVGLTKTWAFSNYLVAWERASFDSYILNSVLYSISCTAMSLLLSLLVAFPISRKYIPVSNFWYYLFLCGLFLPNGIIPLFQIILNSNLYDTRMGYMLVMTGVNATSVFFFNGYLKSLPKDFDEAASMDGCSYLRYIFSFVIPLSKPAISSMGILTFIEIWNDIVSSTIFLSTATKYNITRGLFAFSGQYQNNWTLLAAALIIVAIPVIIVFIYGQRFIIEGVMADGLKG